MPVYIIPNEEGQRIKVKISTDNAAFEDNPDEVKRILQDALKQNAFGANSGTLRDINGNTVGSFRELRD